MLERKPGVLDLGRPFHGDPWGAEFWLLCRELEYRLSADGSRQFIRVLLLLTSHSGCHWALQDGSSANLVKPIGYWHPSVGCSMSCDNRLCLQLLSLGVLRVLVVNAGANSRRRR